MTYTDDTVCSAWATEEELIAHCTSLQTVIDEIPDGVIDQALLAASDALYTLSGRIFSGMCVQILAPSYVPTAQRYCPGLNRINLGVWPVHSVVSVVVDEEELDPSTYSLMGFKYLQFTGEIPAGITVEVQYGLLPPEFGKRACLALACEMLAAFLDDDTALPGGVATSISRQGITEDTINPEDLLENGRTGIYEVDRFLMIYNPRNIPSPSFIISPDNVPSEHIPVEYAWPYGRYF